VRHEVVHNRHVVDRLRGLGAVFVDELDQVPEGATVIFSAHGVSRAVVAEAERRGLRVFDATCPLVTKVHMEVHRYARDARDVILIGHAGHPEVEGTMGQWRAEAGQGHIYLVEDVADAEALQVSQPENLAYTTQTTLSIDETKDIIAALKQRFPKIKGPDKGDLCYATTNRQSAVMEMAKLVDILIVIGSKNSSNSNRLRELGIRKGVPAYLIDDPRDIHAAWFERGARVGLTAGASAPESLVQQVVARLRELGVSNVDELGGEPENVVFSLPKELAGPR